MGTSLVIASPECMGKDVIDHDKLCPIDAYQHQTEQQKAAQ